MKKIGMFLFCAFLCSWAQAEILTFLADNAPMAGPPNILSAFSGPCGVAGANGQAPEGNPPEGYSSWKTTETVTCDTFLGVGLNLAVVQDYSRFQNGELRFWMKASKGDITIEIHDVNWSESFQHPILSKRLDSIGWTPAVANQWVYYHIPFQGNLIGAGLSEGLSLVRSPFVFTAFSTPTTFYIDNVQYVDNTTQEIFNVAIKNINNDQSASAIDWNSTAVSPGAGWVRANQYIQIDTAMDVSPWGVQIYTDNTNGTGNTKFKGDPNVADPSGLVNTLDQASRLPIAWSITANIGAPAPWEPNDTTNGGAVWFYMKDQQTKTIPSNNSTVFQNGDPFMVVKNNLGIHFVQGITLDAADFGAQNSPNYIYLEANFNSALAKSTYTTSRLYLELFTP